MGCSSFSGPTCPCGPAHGPCADGSLRWPLGSDALCRPSQNAVHAHVPVRLALASVAPARAVPLVAARVLPVAPAVAPRRVAPRQEVVLIATTVRVVQHAPPAMEEALLAARVATMETIGPLEVRDRLVPAARRRPQVPGVRRAAIGSTLEAPETVRDAPTVVHAPTGPVAR